MRDSVAAFARITYRSPLPRSTNKYRRLVLSERTTSTRGQATRARRLVALAALESRLHVEFVDLYGALEMDPRRVQRSQEALDAPVNCLVGNVDFYV